MLPKLSFLLLLLISMAARSQTCSAPGQTPGTAFPVCGTNTFTQNDVPICSGRPVPTICTDGTIYLDKNPFWYKFTCFSAGTLVFAVTPINANDDYDWQLFDVTGRNPDAVYTDPSLTVLFNWSAAPGTSGTSLTSNTPAACSGNTPNFSRAPLLIAGHEYLLMVSHYTDSQIGYRLSFGGGTASITDTTPPRLQTAFPSCDGSRINVKLNKKMRCSSLAADRSDFGLTGPQTPGFSTITGFGCSTGFDTDSLQLVLNSPLAAGNYQLRMLTGTDGNTLLDYCNNGIPVNSSLNFAIAYGQPAPFDSLTPPGCAPQTLQVVFRKPVQCSSIAANGSDFGLTGIPAATITAAAATCNNAGLTTGVQLRLSQPLQTAGNYQLVLRRGSDGNTIIDECGQETPENAAIPFSIQDTVAADFTYRLGLGCITDTVSFTHPGGNGINTWRWLFDGTRTSTVQHPQLLYTQFGQKTARLIVSNGTCSDTASAAFNLDNYLEARFSGPAVLCPRDTAYFADSSLGKIRSWQWRFGNGNTSFTRQPPGQVYAPATQQTIYNVQLMVEDSLGCRDTLTRPITIVNNCYIDVPTAFTPNGDGLNDYLYPLNAYKAVQLQFSVYNRWGQRVWQTTDWTRKWDGRFNGQLLETGTYVWFLSYTHLDTRQQIRLQGTTVLIR